jgi:hypothetical protein
MLENTIRRFQSPAVRKLLSFPCGTLKGSNRPEAAIPSRPAVRAMNGRKRPLALRPRCARRRRSDHRFQQRGFVVVIILDAKGACRSLGIGEGRVAV